MTDLEEYIASVFRVEIWEKAIINI